MEGTRRGVIHPTFTTLNVCLWIKSTLASDIALESRRILPQVMPKTSKSPPIGMSEGRSKLAGEIAHRAQMLFKVMNLKGPILVPTHMGQVVLDWR